MSLLPNEFQLPVIQYAPVNPINGANVQDIEWQQRAVDELVAQFESKQHKGCVLKGSTGLGKMYITALALRRMHEKGLLKCPLGSVFPFPVLWVCPKSLKIQTMRTLKDIGVGHLCLVITYGELKSSTGTELFLRYETKLLPNGQPEIIPVWQPLMRPFIIVCDEIQKLKNPDSLQAKTIRYAPDDCLWLGMSATPFQRVADGRTIIERCKVVTRCNVVPCSRTFAPALLREIAEPKSPDQYSPSATGRLREAIDDYIVEIKGVRFKFRTKTHHITIRFKNNEQRRIYEMAYQEYLEELKKKNEYRSHGRMAILVAMQKFQQKAELLRCDQMAERIVLRVREGRQVIMGSNYVDTCRQVYRLLLKMGFDVTRVGWIVGGQTDKARQQMIDSFQDGSLDVILVTVKSGGEGLSLHHDKTTTRPRSVIVPLPWSAIDLVQFLGRGHRLTSLSETHQEMFYFDETIEVTKVRPTVELKMKCLNKTIAAKEQFITLFEKATEDDVDLERSDEINETLGELENSEVDVDATEGEVTGEGLESDDTLPTTYY